MSVRAETILWLAQRVSAGILAFCVLIHLITIVYAVRGGLSGSEVLARLNHDFAWLLFYMVFVGVAAIHAPIGIRAIMMEHTRLPSLVINSSTAAIALILLWLGVRAVLALFGG